MDFKIIMVKNCFAKMSYLLHELFFHVEYSVCICVWALLLATLTLRFSGQQEETTKNEQIDVYHCIYYLVFCISTWVKFHCAQNVNIRGTAMHKHIPKCQLGIKVQNI